MGDPLDPGVDVGEPGVPGVPGGVGVWLPVGAVEDGVPGPRVALGVGVVVAVGGVKCFGVEVGRCVEVARRFGVFVGVAGVLVARGVGVAGGTVGVAVSGVKLRNVLVGRSVAVGRGVTAAARLAHKTASTTAPRYVRRAVDVRNQHVSRKGSNRLLSFRLAPSGPLACNRWPCRPMKMRRTAAMRVPLVISHPRLISALRTRNEGPKIQDCSGVALFQAENRRSIR